MSEQIAKNPVNSSFGFPVEADYRRFRDALEAANFTEAGIRSALGNEDFQSLTGNDVALVLHRTKDETKLSALIRLFLIEATVDKDAARAALAPMDLETLVEAGVVRVEGEAVRAAIELRPCRGFLAAHDPPRRLHSPEGTDYVMGIGLSSLSLGNLTVRRPSRLSLDLGTGCGVQALLAARHSEKVICVDRNPRAVAFASSNAKLNGLTNVECREGDLFEPVRGLLFDLIVSNPPFVISPESRYIFRDGGMEGDAICRHIAGEAPRFLAEGGYFQMLCNWVEPAGENWRERLAGWFEGSGCDAWVLHTKRYDPADYASLWIRHTERDSHQEYLRRFEEWIAYYDRLGIGGMGGGIITLRKAGGRPNWFRADEAPEKTVEAGGEAILLGFELYDFLQTVREDAALLEARAHVSPYTVLDRVSAPFQGKWSDLAMELRLTRGLAYTAKLDGPMANFLACCDGEHPLGELLAKMSASLGVDPAAIAHSFCGLARRLIEMGFLLPPHLLPAEPENGDR